ncbi:MAG: hypothetical protein JJ850_16415 [Kordiimonadaceae bacterium]|nr:hypothetical protein [Kordiimonadaceae bacterium]MBO6569673.1 hypothetical protein [Kordiimonadaceae bacterium]MBO6966208.1 hypothetical protein [Kordiimonadaceae bacterium]
MAKKNKPEKLPKVPDVIQEDGNLLDAMSEQEQAVSAEDYEKANSLRPVDYRERIKKDAETKDHGRKQNILDELSFLSKWFLRLAALLVAGMFFTWIWHMVTPACWHWLGQAQADKIKDLLFSGALSASLTLLGSMLYKKQK